jgi:hypothetical protein
LHGTKEYMTAVELDRARWAAHDALVSEALAGRPKRSKRALIGRALVWLGNQLVFAGDRLTLRVPQASRVRAHHEFEAEQANF